MSVATKNSDRLTYRQYLSWPKKDRYELIDGAAYLMAPAPSLSHQDLVGEIYFQLRTGLHGKACRAFVAPLDVRLPELDEADDDVDTVLQPDVLVVCDAKKLDSKGVRGAPDFVVEVLSPTSAAQDHVRKKRIYERVGVREYWLVHPVDRIVTIYRLENGEFSKADILELIGATQISIFPGLEIVWDEIVARLMP